MTSGFAKLSRLRVGVLQFPGSNCDADCVDALRRHFKIDARLIWHEDRTLPPLDAVVIPGGFSFGDYLRSGALAAHASIMRDVGNFTEKGGAVLGICNGFQILVESQILPGALLQNMSRSFICKYVYLRDSKGQVLKMPIAHGEGRYWIDEDSLSRLESEGRIAYRYADEDGGVNIENNPNGAVANIAGIFSKNKKVLGMMPHPERATDVVMGGSSDGLTVLTEFLERV